MKQAWILQGGWEGHEPDKTAPRFKKMLEDHGYQATIYQSLDCLADEQEIRKLDLVVACWTMGEIDREYSRNLSRAVGAGVGLAGCHGGMCDSFRKDTEWQFMTGGQWVSHPGGDGVDQDLALHRAIAEATGNPQFGRLLGFLEQYLREAMRVTRGNEARHQHFADAVRQEHQALVEAIAAGDEQGARAIATGHMEKAADRLVQVGALPLRRKARRESKP